MVQSLWRIRVGSDRSSHTIEVTYIVREMIDQELGGLSDVSARRPRMRLKKCYPAGPHPSIEWLQCFGMQQNGF
jgi:hypothetical protein